RRARLKLVDEAEIGSRSPTRPLDPKDSFEAHTSDVDEQSSAIRIFYLQRLASCESSSGHLRTSSPAIGFSRRRWAWEFRLSPPDAVDAPGACSLRRDPRALRAGLSA